MRAWWRKWKHGTHGGEYGQLNGGELQKVESYQRVNRKGYDVERKCKIQIVWKYYYYMHNPVRIRK